VQRIVTPVIYLLKRLKQIGFKDEVLIMVYNAYALSHFTYSAPVFSSASLAMKTEMESFQKRALRIINISPEKARDKYKITSIVEHLDKVSVNVLQRILLDRSHPLTVKVSKDTGSRLITRSNFPYLINIGRTEAYNDSFIPKYLRFIRDGTSDLYKQRRVNSSNIMPVPKEKPVKRLYSPAKATNIKAKVECPACGTSLKVLDQRHLKSCKPPP